MQNKEKLRKVVIKIAVIDDDDKCRSDIKKIAEKSLEEQDVSYVVSTYASPMELIADLEQGAYYGIFLIDVEMPGMSGLELAKKVQEFYTDVVIIFITDYVKYSPGAFEVNAFRYILKKDLSEKLPLAFQKIVPKVKEQEKGCYIVRHYLDADVLLYREIYYIKKEGKNAVFVHTNGSSYERKSLKKIIEELPEKQFIEVSRGYIVNVSCVKALRDKEILMQNGDEIPVGRGNVETLIERIAEYWNSKK